MFHSLRAQWHPDLFLLPYCFLTELWAVDGLHAEGAALVAAEPQLTHLAIVDESVGPLVDALAMKVVPTRQPVRTRQLFTRPRPSNQHPIIEVAQADGARLLFFSFPFPIRASTCSSPRKGSAGIKLICTCVAPTAAGASKRSSKGTF